MYSIIVLVSQWKDRQLEKPSRLFEWDLANWGCTEIGNGESSSFPLEKSSKALLDSNSGFEFELFHALIRNSCYWKVQSAEISIFISDSL